MIEIKNFVDCPECLPEIAARIHAQWFANKAGHTEEGMLARMRTGRRSEIPIGLVAFVDGRPAGTVSLLASDLAEREDLTPWLAGLLVFPDFRERGVGSELVRELMRIGRDIGCTTIYLYTDKPGFYERLGWRRYSDVASEPELHVMSCNVCAAVS